jgi:hypothetical protein
MARLHLIQLICDRPERERDRVELCVLTADGSSSSRTNEMRQGDVWRVGTAVDFEHEATVSLVQVDAGHSLGRVDVSDEPTMSQDAPWSQFRWHGAHYTLVYHVRASPETGDDVAEPAVWQDGYCVAPYENNRVRLQLPKALIYHPTRNKPGRSDASLFTGESRQLAADLRDWLSLWAETIGIDNGVNDSASAHDNTAQVLSDLEERESSYTCLSREDRLRAFVLACHGFPHGVQLGFSLRDDQGGTTRQTRRAQTERLLDLLASIATNDVKLILYACSTGAPDGARQGNNSTLSQHYQQMGGGWWRRIKEAARDYSPPTWPEDIGSSVWGATSFAEYLRDGMHARGRTHVEVYGHSDVAHAFWFPGVLRFRGGGNGEVPSGGEWVVDQGPHGGSAEVRAFRSALRRGNLRYRYPWMTAEEIAAELSG